MHTVLVLLAFIFVMCQTKFRLDFTLRRRSCCNCVSTESPTPKRCRDVKWTQSRIALSHTLSSTSVMQISPAIHKVVQDLLQNLFILFLFRGAAHGAAKGALQHRSRLPTYFACNRNCFTSGSFLLKPLHNC